MMSNFDQDQTQSHRVINKRIGVEEFCSYIEESICNTVGTMHSYISTA